MGRNEQTQVERLRAELEGARADLEALGDEITATADSAKQTRLLTVERRGGDRIAVLQRALVAAESAAERGAEREAEQRVRTWEATGHPSALREHEEGRDRFLDKLEAARETFDAWLAVHSKHVAAWERHGSPATARPPRVPRDFADSLVVAWSDRSDYAQRVRTIVR